MEKYYKRIKTKRERERWDASYEVDVEDFSRSESFVIGARWADDTMIKKACEWLQDNAYKYLSDPDSTIDDMIFDFKIKMEQ
jgi:hypothetical protein